MEGDLAHCSIFDINNNALLLNEAVINGGTYKLIPYNILAYNHPPGSLMRLDVTAYCSSDHEKQVMSGTYIAKGVFGERVIYEKINADVNGKWWSLRYDRPREDPISTQRWIFMYNTHQVTMGESIFGSVIENYSNRPGKSR